MRRLKNILCLTLIALTALALGSCRKSSTKPTPTPTITKGLVTVAFDWSAAITAPNEQPKSMAVYFYPTSTSKTALKYHITNTTSAKIDLPLGEYNFACYNDDVEGFTLRGDATPDRIELALSSRNEPTWNNVTKAGAVEPVVHEADTLYFSYVSQPFTMRVNAAGTAATPVTVNAAPVRKTLLCNFNVSNIPASIDVWSAYAVTLSGMIRSYKPGSDAAGTDVVTLAGKFAYSDYEHHSVTGVVGALGVDAASAHYLTLYCILADGLQHKLTMDVTDEVNNAAITDRALSFDVDLSTKPYTLEAYDPSDADNAFDVLLRIGRWIDGGDKTFGAE